MRSLVAGVLNYELPLNAASRKVGFSPFFPLFWGGGSEHFLFPFIITQRSSNQGCYGGKLANIKGNLSAEGSARKRKRSRTSAENAQAERINQSLKALSLDPGSKLFFFSPPDSSRSSQEARGGKHFLRKCWSFSPLTS